MDLSRGELSITLRQRLIESQLELIEVRRVTIFIPSSTSWGPYFLQISDTINWDFYHCTV